MNVDVNFDTNTVATSADGFTLYANTINDPAPLGAFTGTLNGTGTMNNNFVFTSNLDGTLVGGSLTVFADLGVEGVIGVYENNLFGVGTIDGSLNGANFADTISAGFLVTE